MPLKPDDHRLSMRLSPRGKRPDPPGLRTLLIHRLSDTAKLVMRRGLRSDDVSAFCEKCDDWTIKGIDDSEHCAEWYCERCRRLFRLEFAVFEEISPEAD